MKSAILFCLAVIMLMNMPSVPLQAQTTETSGSARDIAWSSDGSQIAVSGTFGIAIYDTNFVIDRVLTTQPVDRLSWSPDGTLLATQRYTGNKYYIDFWNMQSKQKVATIPIMDSIVESVWSPNSQQLAVVSYFEEIYIFDVATQTLILTLSGGPSGIDSAAWSPNGALIAAAGGGSESPAAISVWHVNTGDLAFSIDLTATERFYRVPIIAWNPDSTKIALGTGPTEKGSIPILDVASQNISKAYDFTLEPFTFVSWSPDGTKLAAADDGVTGSTLYYWNALTQEQLWLERLSGYDHHYLGGAWKPDGSQLAMLVRSSKDRQTTVHIIDAETGEEVTVLALPDVTPTPTPTSP